MNKEQIQQAAKEFCEAEGLPEVIIMGFGRPKIKPYELVVKFLQSMIDRGYLFDSDHVSELKNEINILSERIEHLTESVTSAGKEYEIDVSGNVKFRVSIIDNEPKFTAAMDGYGDSINVNNIRIISVDEYNQLPESTVPSADKEVKKLSDWISVKDRFPDKTCCVIIYGSFTRDCPQRSQEALFVKKGNNPKYWFFYNNSIKAKNVTHWMEMPKSPN